MARFVKHTPGRKYLLLLACIALLALFFVADFLRASSSSSSSSRYSIDKTAQKTVAVETKLDDKKGNMESGGRTVQEELNATYADLPAPMLEWEEMAECPVPRLDGSSIQIGNLWYVIGGYGDINHVHSHVDVYNFSNDTWVERFGMPKEMANSHLGIATDGRYIFAISGQYGPQCRSSISRSFVLDTKSKRWHDFPSLPSPRYAPATQLWRGRLHVMGGGKKDRREPALEHWSIAVKDGKALEKEWKPEIPIPRGGPHRACVVVNDQLLVIGGQEGDFIAKPGSPIFKCTRKREVLYADVYMLDGKSDDTMKWTKLPPMPKKNSHIESAWVLVNNSIIILGGTTVPHPITRKMNLVGEVFRFRFDKLEWSVIGRMPFRVKTTLAGFWDGWLYFSSGQRDRGPDKPEPRKVIGDTWRTKLHL